MHKISILGAGAVGTTLGMLFARQGLVVGEVYSRTASKANRACDLIGQGTAVTDFDKLTPADIYMVTASESALPLIADQLATSNILRSGDIVFHCSGMIPSTVFEKLRALGVHIASVHPVNTFGAPTETVEKFPGTWCGVEGDTAALNVLTPLFESIGGNVFRIDPSQKTLYHTALVFMCNYIFPLIDAGLGCLKGAGVSRQDGMKLIEPLLLSTIQNALKLGPAQALTGPIARGDVQVVKDQLQALENYRPEYKKFYAALGKMTVPLAAEKGVAAPDTLEAIRRLFDPSTK